MQTEISGKYNSPLFLFLFYFFIFFSYSSSRKDQFAASQFIIGTEKWHRIKMIHLYFLSFPFIRGRLPKSICQPGKN